MRTSSRYAIRRLKTLEDCQAVAALERDVWGYTDAEDVVPPPVLMVSIKRGGILIGAFDGGGSMKGFVYSMAAIKDGGLTQWSHMLGVVANARGAGLGTQLKIAQREAALGMGIELIEWTYDPLQAANAHLNIARLGTVVHHYEENLYGPSSSPLHQGTPTDRFIAEWHLLKPHVERRISTIGMPAVQDRSVTDARPVNSTRDTGEWLVPASDDLGAADRRLLVEIPTGFSEMQSRNPDLALEWRLSTRRIFQAYFGRGYRAVDFLLAPEMRRGQDPLVREP